MSTRLPSPAVLWDLDGTLVDSAADIASAISSLGVGKLLTVAGVHSGAWIVLRRIGAFLRCPFCAQSHDASPTTLCRAPCYALHSFRAPCMRPRPS